ncbi:MAG: hypothetical protein AAB787_01875 [Patescibacteria group bacterium]
MSTNLRNKSYYIENKPYSKEEYFKKLAEYKLDSHFGREQAFSRFQGILKQQAIHRFAFIEKSNDVSGNIIFNSKNSHFVFDAYDTEDSKYSMVCPDMKDSMDSYHVGFKCELDYETHALIRCYDTQFTHLSYDNSHLSYCDSCHNSENLFGCVGLKSSKYSIFNKKLNTDEFKLLKDRIITHMKETGEYGEFFPRELSPFGYNETQGQIYMPFESREEALKNGWKWEDEAVTGTFGKETLKPEEVPDLIDNVEDSILNEVLVCISCNRNYRIVNNELNFYRRGKIPIPRACPECRYKTRLSFRPPRKLWHRKCMCNTTDDQQLMTNDKYKNTAQHFHSESPCPNEFETSYAPERPEIVYCEQCYNAEVV